MKINYNNGSLNMKQAIFLVTFLLLINVGSAADSSGQLFAFEDGFEGINARSGVTVTEDANEVISGKKSLKIDTTADPQRYNFMAHVPLNYIPDKTYRVRFKYKILKGSENGLFALSASQGLPSGDNVAAFELSGSTGVKEAGFKFTASGDKPFMIRYNRHGKTWSLRVDICFGGIIIIDDLEISEVVEAAVRNKDGEMEFPWPIHGCWPLKSASPSFWNAPLLFWDTSDEPGLQGGAGDWNDNNWNIDPEGKVPRCSWIAEAAAKFTRNAVVSGGDIRFKSGLIFNVADGVEVVIKSRITGGRERPEYKWESTTWELPYAGIYKDEKGTLTLEAENAYLGPTTVSDGVLKLTTPKAIPGRARSLRPRGASTVAVTFPPDKDFLSRFAPGQALPFTLAMAGDFSNDIDLSGMHGLGMMSLGGLGKRTYKGKLAPYDNIFRLGGSSGELVLSKPINAENLMVGGYKNPAVVNLAGGSKVKNVVIQDSTLKIDGKIMPATAVDIRAVAVPGNKVKVTWLDKANNEARYIVERSTDGKSFTEIAAIAKDATEYIDEKLPKAEKLYYRVFSKADLLCDDPDIAVAITAMPEKLYAPEIIELYGSYKWVDVKWVDSNDGEAGYTVQIAPYAAGDDSAAWKEVARTAANKIRAHIYLPETKRRFFRVAALAPDGSPGPFSRGLSADTDKDADIEQDIIKRFGLLDANRKFDPTLPATSDNYSEAEKEDQRKSWLTVRADLEKKAKSDSEYIIPPGIYRVSKGVSFNGLLNFKVKAAGVTFILESGTAKGRQRWNSIFYFPNCKDCSLEGPIVARYSLPYWSVGKIIGIDTKNKRVEVEYLPGFSTEFRTDNFTDINIFNNKGRFIWEFQYRKDIKHLGGRTYSVYIGAVPNAKVMFAKGDYITMPSAHTKEWLVVDPGHRGSCNMTYKDIVAYGLGFGHDSTKGFTKYINYRVLSEPGTSQLGCGQPGQYHKSKGDSLILDGCEFNGGGDDGINLMTSSGVCVRQDGPRTVYLQHLYRHNKIGRRLRFYDYLTNEFLGEAKVAAFEVLDHKKSKDPAEIAAIEGGNIHLMNIRSRWHARTKMAKITLDRNLNGLTHAQVVDPEYGAEEVIVRNTYWRDMHAMALLLQTCQSGQIINNVMSGNTHSAILVSLSKYWQEGMWGENMVFCNNVIRNNPSAYRAFGDASIRIEVGARFGGKPSIENITMEGNHIYYPGYSGIEVNNLVNSKIVRNTIVHPGTLGWRKDFAGITIPSGGNMEVSDNTVILNGSMVTQGIFFGDAAQKETMKISGNKVIKQADVSPTPDYQK